MPKVKREATYGAATATEMCHWTKPKRSLPNVWPHSTIHYSRYIAPTMARCIESIANGFELTVLLYYCGSIQFMLVYLDIPHILEVHSSSCLRDRSSRCVPVSRHVLVYLHGDSSPEFLASIDSVRTQFLLDSQDLVQLGQTL